MATDIYIYIYDMYMYMFRYDMCMYRYDVRINEYCENQLMVSIHQNPFTFQTFNFWSLQKNN